MASIPKLNDFNTDRKDLMKIKTIEDEIILFTKSEAREALIEYIDEELDFISHGVVQRRVNDIIESVDRRLMSFERKLENHISDKINAITERIISNATSRIVEERVNERLNEKLDKLKTML